MKWFIPARLALRAALVGLPLVAMFALAGCQSCKDDKKPGSDLVAAPALAGLQAVPPDAQVVLGADVKRLRESWLVRRAIRQMFRRDPELKTRIDQLIETCKLDPAEQIDNVIVALNESSQDAIMVVTGAFVEAELASCVGQSVEAGGGSLTFEQVEGRTFYRASGRQDVWFTLSGERTLIVATSSAWLSKAVGSGEKVTQAKPMASLLGRVDQRLGLWGAGIVNPQIGAGLVKLTSGAVASPPQSMLLEMDLSAGITASLGAEMASEKDAKSASSLAKSQLAVGAWALHKYGLEAVAKKLTVDSKGKTVYLRLSLAEDELKEVLSRIDTSGGSEQDPPEPEPKP